MLSRAREEDGVTIVEGLVAGLIMLIGILGSVSVFDSSGRESATGERQQIAVEQAQAELERLRDLPVSELAINDGTTWPDDSDLAGDPVNRLDTTAGTFRVAPGTTEELVTAGNGGLSASDPLTVSAGDSMLDMTIYRFVTWRDVECPVADLGGLTGAFTPLTDVNEDILSALLGPGSILNTLLGSLLNVVPTQVRERLTSARTLATTIQNEIVELNAALNGIQELDPCDANVDSLQEAQANLAALEPVLDEVDNAVLGYRNACVTVLGLVVSCPSLTSTVGQTLNNAVRELEDGDLDVDLNALIDSISGLETIDHNRNTKRLTVAVAFEDRRQGSGPSKPVWATSVASDPDAGLLSSP